MITRTPTSLARRHRWTALGVGAASFALTKRGFTDPLLDRVRAASDRDAEVSAAWGSPAVHTRIRSYIEQTIGRSASGA